MLGCLKSISLHISVFACLYYLSVCLCCCMGERQRERQRETLGSHSLACVVACALICQATGPLDVTHCECPHWTTGLTVSVLCPRLLVSCFHRVSCPARSTREAFVVLHTALTESMKGLHEEQP